MNKRQIYERINKNISLIRISNRKTNCLRWGSNETDDHIRVKLEVCKLLKRAGCDFITEAIFTNGLRADCVDLFNGVVYEIYDSEGQDSIDRKKTDYPLTVIAISAKSTISQITKILGY